MGGQGCVGICIFTGLLAVTFSVRTIHIGRSVKFLDGNSLLTNSVLLLLL